MSELLLLTARGCHLCAHARQVLGQLEDEHRLSWREVPQDSGAEGRRLAAGAPPLRPVLFTAEGRILAYGRLSARRLARDLHSDRTVSEEAGERAGMTRSRGLAGLHRAGLHRIGRRGSRGLHLDRRD